MQAPMRMYQSLRMYASHHSVKSKRSNWMNVLIAKQIRCMCNSTPLRVGLDCDLITRPTAWFGKSVRRLSTESTSLLKILLNELQHEKDQYNAPTNVKAYLEERKEWKFEEKEGDVNMVLTEEAPNGNKVTVEFQLVSPFQGDSNESENEMTDFSVTVTNPKSEGMTFYCTTLQNNEKFRYMIGNLRYFSNEEDKNNVAAYNGPEFEDLDDTLQQALDEWLMHLGVDESLCDFIDGMAIDKEQREYMRWVKNIAGFVEGK